MSAVLSLALCIAWLPTIAQQGELVGDLSHDDVFPLLRRLGLRIVDYNGAYANRYLARVNLDRRASPELRLMDAGHARKPVGFTLMLNYALSKLPPAAQIESFKSNAADLVVRVNATATLVGYVRLDPSSPVRQLKQDIEEFAREGLRFVKTFRAFSPKPFSVRDSGQGIKPLASTLLRHVGHEDMAVLIRAWGWKRSSAFGIVDNLSSWHYEVVVDDVDVSITGWSDLHGPPMRIHLTGVVQLEPGVDALALGQRLKRERRITRFALRSGLEVFGYIPIATGITVGSLQAKIVEFARWIKRLPRR